MQDLSVDHSSKHKDLGVQGGASLFSATPIWVHSRSAAPERARLSAHWGKIVVVGLGSSFRLPPKKLSRTSQRLVYMSLDATVGFFCRDLRLRIYFKASSVVEGACFVGLLPQNLKGSIRVSRLLPTMGSRVDACGSL